MATAAPTRDLKSIKYVTIHHSAVAPGSNNLEELKVRAVSHDRHHGNKDYALATKGEKGFKYISYHYMIARDGSILQVQDIKYQRYHATDTFRGTKSHNTYGIAILLEGNFDVEETSPAQLNAAVNLIKYLQRQLNTRLEIKGHSEQAHPANPTSCPGKNMGTTADRLSKLSQIVYAVKVPQIDFITIIRQIIAAILGLIKK